MRKLYLYKIMYFQSGGVKIEYNPNTPAVVSKEYLEKNIYLYFEDKFSEKELKDLKQNIKNIIKQYINAELTDLITNVIIPNDIFWPFILEIYRDLILILNTTSIDFRQFHFTLSDFSHLVIKGGNIIKLLFDNFVNKLNENIENQDKIDNFLKDIDIFFRKSDIDFGLVINYDDDRLQNDILRALVLKSIDTFKINCKIKFDEYKTTMLPKFNTLTEEIRENSIKKINTSINNLAIIVEKIFTEIGDETLGIKKKEIEEYILSFRVLDIGIDTRKSPTDTVLKTYIPIINNPDDKEEEIELLQEEDDPEYLSSDIIEDIDLDLYIDDDIKLEEIFTLPELTIDYRNYKNKVENTNLFWQDNEKLIFFVTKNLRLEGEMSSDTKGILKDIVSHFSLLRLFFSYQIKHEAKKRLIRPRGELIDLTINLPDDYYGKLFYHDIDNHIANYSLEDTTLSITSYNPDLTGNQFYSYKLDYIIIELIDMIFGVKGDNIFIISAYKFTKRLNRLFILIIVRLFYEFPCGLIVDLLNFLISKINDEKPVEFLLRVSKGLPPKLTRSKSIEFGDLSVLYFSQRDSMLNRILNSSFIPLFRIIFQTYSRILGKDVGLISVDLLLSKQLVYICEKFITVLEGVPDELILL